MEEEVSPMAVPKRKSTTSRRGMRRSHDAQHAPALAVDKATKSVHRPHHIDLNTGYYNGKQVWFKEDDDDTADEG